jgi:hypothetical protein
MGNVKRSKLVVIEEKRLQQRNSGKIDAGELVVDDPQII